MTPPAGNDFRASNSIQLGNISSSLDRIQGSLRGGGGSSGGAGGLIFFGVFAGVLGAVAAVAIQPFLLAPGFLILAPLDGTIDLPAWLARAPGSWPPAALITVIWVMALARYAPGLTWWQRWRRLVIVTGLLIVVLALLGGPGDLVRAWFGAAWDLDGLWATCRLGAYYAWGFAAGLLFGTGFAVALLFLQDASLMVQAAVFFLGSGVLMALLWTFSRAVLPEAKRWSLVGCYLGPNLVVTAITLLIAIYRMEWLDSLAGGSLW